MILSTLLAQAQCQASCAQGFTNTLFGGTMPGLPQSALFAQIASYLGNIEQNLVAVASGIFFALVAIDFAWMMIQALMKGTEVGELFAQVIQRVIVINLIYWIFIRNGYGIVVSIISSFNGIGVTNSQGLLAGMSSASTQLPPGLNLSSSTDPLQLLGEGIAFAMANFFVAYAITFTPFDPENVTGMTQLGTASIYSTEAASFVVLICFVFICATLELAILEAYVVANVGIVLTGLMGSRWTSSIGDKYFSYAVSVGMKLMVTYIISGLIVTYSGEMLGITLVPFVGPYFSAALAGVLAIIAWQAPQFAASMVQGSSMSSAASTIQSLASVGLGTAGLISGFPAFANALRGNYAALKKGGLQRGLVDPADAAKGAEWKFGDKPLFGYSTPRQVAAFAADKKTPTALGGKLDGKVAPFSAAAAKSVGGGDGAIAQLAESGKDKYPVVSQRYLGMEPGKRADYLAKVNSVAKIGLPPNEDEQKAALADVEAHGGEITASAKAIADAGMTAFDAANPGDYKYDQNLGQKREAHRAALFAEATAAESKKAYAAALDRIQLPQGYARAPRVIPAGERPRLLRNLKPQPGQPALISSGDPQFNEPGDESGDAVIPDNFVLANDADHHTYGLGYEYQNESVDPRVFHGNKARIETGTQFVRRNFARFFSSQHFQLLQSPDVLQRLAATGGADYEMFAREKMTRLPADQTRFTNELGHFALILQNLAMMSGGGGAGGAVSIGTPMISHPPGG